MAYLKKNRFWIACFMLAAAMIGTWFYATGVLKAATDKRVGEINTSNSTIEGVMKVSAEEGASAHPNATTEAGMQVKLDELSESVLAAWQSRYEAQQKIMQWPEEILTAALVLQFQRYNPPETLPAEEKGQSPNLIKLLEVYKQQIPSQMKNICAIIQSDWKYQEQLDKKAFFGSTDDKQAEGGDAGESETEDGEADEDDQDPLNHTIADSTAARQIVKWSDINQDLWFQKLTSFKGRDDNEFNTQLPSPSQVYMLQQDLWLLEAMFDIIRNVNARMDDDGKPMMGPDDKPMMVLANDLAPIKKIDHVVFGREALSSLGEITETAAAATIDSGGRGGLGGVAGRNSGSAKTSDSDTKLSYKGQPAFHGRYVNSNFEPIEADTIRKILTEKTLPAENLELVVAKRVPVRIAVQMDERKIPDFLAACANSPFAFEVWQVRINEHDPKEEIKLRGSEGAGDGGIGGRGGEPGGDRAGGAGDEPSGKGIGGATGGSMGGIGGLGGGEGRGDGGSSDSKGHVALRKNYDVGVEFYGIVKIYNPVHKEILTGEQTTPPTNP